MAGLSSLTGFDAADGVSKHKTTTLSYVKVMSPQPTGYDFAVVSLNLLGTQELWAIGMHYGSKDGFGVQLTGTVQTVKFQNTGALSVSASGSSMLLLHVPNVGHARLVQSMSDCSTACD